jgi:DNA-binding MarR family transcriptional regulator
MIGMGALYDARAMAADEEGMRILNSIRQLVRALRLFDREAQTRYGVSAAQMFVLHAVEQEEGLSLSALATRTATDQSSVSVVVQRLVEGGYVLRSAGASDRRRHELRLTPKGRAVIRKAPPPAQQKILAAVAAMTANDRRELATLLEGFVSAVGVRGPKAPLLFEDGGRARRARGR